MHLVRRRNIPALCGETGWGEDMEMSTWVQAALDAIPLLGQATEETGMGGGTDLGGVLGFINYGVLGLLALGFIKGWVATPKERDRLAADLDKARSDLKDKDAEIARLNGVIQDNLQAMTATMDKQIDLSAARMRQKGSSSHGGS